jgi:hypothetical protein
MELPEDIFLPALIVTDKTYFLVQLTFRVVFLRLITGMVENLDELVVDDLFLFSFNLAFSRIACTGPQPSSKK